MALGLGGEQVVWWPSPHMGRHGAMHLAAVGEEGALGAGSCRCLLSWDETGLRKLGDLPSACQVSKSDVAGLNGLVHHRCTEKYLRVKPPVRGRSGTLKSAQCVGPRVGLGGMTTSPFPFRVKSIHH